VQHANTSAIKHVSSNSSIMDKKLTAVKNAVCNGDITYSELATLLQQLATLDGGELAVKNLQLAAQLLRNCDGGFEE